MSKTEQDDIVKNLKACVSSNRGGIPVSALCRKYRAVSLWLSVSNSIFAILFFTIRAPPMAEKLKVPLNRGVLKQIVRAINLFPLCKIKFIYCWLVLLPQ
jgi:hypothetical protein